MTSLDTLAEVSKILRLLAGGMLYRRIIGNIAMIAAFAVATGLLAGALLLIGAYALYLFLLSTGFGSAAAIAVVAGIIIASIAACITAIIHYIHKIRGNLSPTSSLPDVKRIAHAFVDGLTEPRRKEPQYHAHP